MKQIIEQILQKHGTQQINLGSSAAQSMLADEITTELKSNGLYNPYSKIELDEQKAKESWVCQTCGKSTFETEYDYLVHPKLHLGCALKEELKGKDIKEQYHEASSKLFKVGKRESVKYSSKGPEYDYRENPQLELEMNKLSEEIVDSKSKKYLYESDDGGKTIYRREFQKSEKEVVEDWKEEMSERKEMIEKSNASDRKWSGRYEDFVAKEKQVDERMKENLDWYKDWKKGEFNNDDPVDKDRKRYAG